jgi:NAD(P)-dependent dehydrogenase (short-subunit alcohol dehydrogenase family)
LVNNAGDILRPGAWDEQSDEDLERTIYMHLVGPIRLIRGLAPKMAEDGYGRIINIASTYGITGAAAVLSYTAAKAGLISVTYSMARELGSSGITVNAIAPGNFDTAMTESAGPDMKEWAISTTPLARLGEPSEVAHAMRYLLDAEFVTGTVLVVDGGQLLNV